MPLELDASNIPEGLAKKGKVLATEGDRESAAVRLANGPAAAVMIARSCGRGPRFRISKCLVGSLASTGRKRFSNGPCAPMIVNSKNERIRQSKTLSRRGSHYQIARSRNSGWTEKPEKLERRLQSQVWLPSLACARNACAQFCNMSNLSCAERRFT